MGMLWYGVVVALIKISIILQYLRLFVPARNIVYWLLHSLIWAHVVFYIACTGLQIYSICTSHQAYDRSGEFLTFNLWVACVNTINTGSDILLAVIAQIFVWRSRMTIKEKWKLSTVFVVGLWYVSLSSSLGSNLRA